MGVGRGAAHAVQGCRPKARGARAIARFAGAGGVVALEAKGALSEAA